MKSGVRFFLWTAVALLGALALATIALHRGEQINALWLVAAAICTYALGYRFYSGLYPPKFWRLIRYAPLPPSVWRMGVTSFLQISGLSSGTISPQLPDRDRWLGRCSRHSLVIFRGRCGY